MNENKKKMTLQELHKKQQKNTNILWTIFIILVIILFGCIHINDNAKQANHNEANYVSRLATTNSSLIDYNKEPHYVVNAQGHMDYYAQDTIANIKKTFNMLNTYKSGKQYAQNRKKAMNYIKDPKFFKNEYKPMIDKSGDSEIDAVSLFSDSDNTVVYEISSNRYLVITKNFFYHNRGDLNYEDEIQPTTRCFDVSGNSSTLNNISEIKNLSKNTK